MRPTEALDIVLAAPEDLSHPSGESGFWNESSLEDLEAAANLLLAHGYLELDGQRLTRTASDEELNSLG